MDLALLPLYPLGLLIVLIGLLLGLLGGGGSILLVPTLVFLAGWSVQQAILSALIVVGITSLVALIGHARQKTVCWKNGAVFGASGMIGAYGGGHLAKELPSDLLLLLLAIMMIWTSLSMLVSPRQRPTDIRRDDQPACPTRLNLPEVLFDGFLVGTMTGLIGVGGGFVIVPALHLLGKLPIRSAIGTSLLVISMNCVAAFFGISGEVPVEAGLTAMMTGLAIIGALVGQAFAQYAKQTILRRLFALMALAIAGTLIQKELQSHTQDAFSDLWIQHRDFLKGFLTALGLMFLYWMRGLSHHRHPNIANESRSLN